MLLYSTAENDHAYLTKKGIDNLRHLFGTEIFKDEIHEIYDWQTEVRNRITKEMRERFKKLAKELRAGETVSEELQERLVMLADRLNAMSGYVKTTVRRVSAFRSGDQKNDAALASALRLLKKKKH